MNNNVEIAEILTDWQIFYKELFGLDVDLSSLVIPSRQPGLGRLMVIVQGVTIKKAHSVCQKLFPCWEYAGENLDEAVPKHDRTADQGAYVIWIIEDEELKNESADDLSVVKIPIKMLTLLERLIYELKFFKETGDYLDEKITMCAGSYDRVGMVPPSAGWYDGRFYAGWGLSALRFEVLARWSRSGVVGGVV